MTPIYEPIDVDKILPLTIELSNITRTLKYSYRQLYDILDEALFYATNSTVNQEFVKHFRQAPAKRPGTDDVRTTDFVALGNVLFVYGKIR